jgi:hypothetical protein
MDGLALYYKISNKEFQYSEMNSEESRGETDNTFELDI